MTENRRAYSRADLQLRLADALTREKYLLDIIERLERRLFWLTEKQIDRLNPKRRWNKFNSPLVQLMNNPVAEFENLVRSKSDGTARETGIDSIHIQNTVKDALYNSVQQRGITWTRANVSNVIHEAIDKYLAIRNIVPPTEESIALKLTRAKLVEAQEAGDRLTKENSALKEEIAAVKIYVEQQQKEIDRLTKENGQNKRVKGTEPPRNRTKTRTKSKA